MGYTDYLKNLLSPLGVYDLESGYCAAELYALGKAMDGCCDKTELAERECVVPTAEGLGLLAYETILPSVSSYTDMAARRTAITALLQVDDTSFTAEALNRTLSGYGINAAVSETDVWDTLSVSFSAEIRGIPADIDKLKKRIEAILPCHLNVIYIYNFPTWDQIAAVLPTWDDIDNAGMTVAELEKYE